MISDYLKRDDQILVYRLQNEATRERMAKVAVARDKDRAFGPGATDSLIAQDEMDIDDSAIAEDPTAVGEEGGIPANKTIIIHPGSQNLRIGFGSDVLPKTVPMCIARKSDSNESEDPHKTARPRRHINVDDEDIEVNRQFGKEFLQQFAAMSTDMKQRLRRKGRRIIPNCKEVAISFNKKTPPTSINERNDFSQIDWTEFPSDPRNAPECFTGHEALRIPDESKPRYRLKWPLRYGYFNEEDYDSQAVLFRDFAQIIEDALKKQLGIARQKDLAQYGCVFVIPDLYEKSYVVTVLDLLFREFGFGRVCFQQESLSASFGAGYPTCVIVDIGAQKTSICCVDEGMCIENSRINMRYGGLDVTQTFLKMLLVDHFPYTEIDINRRHDFLVAEEIKQKFCTLQFQDLNAQQFEFFLRTYNNDTLNYLFKAYDHIVLAPMALFKTDILGDVTEKVSRRRHLINRSCDLYDGSPNDPTSQAQAQVLAASPKLEVDQSTSVSQNENKPGHLTSKIERALVAPKAELTPQPIGAMSPAHEDMGTPQGNDGSTPAVDGKEGATNSQLHPLIEQIHSADVRDRTIPCIPLNRAIVMSIESAAKGDDRKTRDFFGGILPIGGGAQIQNFNQFLEEELHDSHAVARFRKEIMVAPPPREIDPQVLVWKGASVFGKLKTNDSWISPIEYDRLGSRTLAYKCMWNW